MDHPFGLYRTRRGRRRMRQHWLPGTTALEVGLGQEARWPQVLEDLLARIRSGELPVGGHLPSLARLAVEHEVSQRTVQKAVERLRVAGVVRGDGSGVPLTVVAVPGPGPLPLMRTVEERLAALEARMDAHERECGR